MYLIWWLNQADCERIPLEIENNIPEYIRSEFRSRKGRNGRGRLWVPEEIPLEEIKWDNTKPMTALAGEAGGIVIKEEDVKYIAGLPGFITDTNLDLWVPNI